MLKLFEMMVLLRKKIGLIFFSFIFALMAIERRRWSSCINQTAVSAHQSVSISGFIHHVRRYCPLSADSTRVIQIDRNQSQVPGLFGNALALFGGINWFVYLRKYISNLRRPLKSVVNNSWKPLLITTRICIVFWELENTYICK